MIGYKTIVIWFVFLLGCIFQVSGQQYDKVWALGTPVTTMTFGVDSILLNTLPDTTTRSFITIGNICDSSGNFLLYTNGVYVRNRFGNIMPHGDSLSYPSTYYNQVVYQGMPNRQGVVCLPDPGDTNRYYIFHFTGTDTLIQPGGYECTRLYYSLVDLSLDSGRGDLVAKNVVILQGLLSASRLAVCRHSNGRDWWIVKPSWHENTYYTFLLTPNGIQGPFSQQIGPKYGLNTELPAYSSFSPNGNKYASVTGESRIVIMDFDRCTGLFSNPDSLVNNDSDDPIGNPISGGNSFAFSPNGRFLYVDIPRELNQYDLWSPQIHDSIRIKTDTAEQYQMNILQLAPNGKIYVSCWNGGSYKMHVINQPDSLGLACDFQLFGQPVLSQSPLALPYFPNFRLGPLNGSGCDTISNGIRKIDLQDLKIEPNPASNVVTILFPSTTEACEIDLYDNLGQLVLSKSVEAGSGSTNIDVTALPEGIYIIRLMGSGARILSSKLVVNR